MEDRKAPPRPKKMFILAACECELRGSAWKAVYEELWILHSQPCLLSGIILAPSLKRIPGLHYLRLTNAIAIATVAARCGGGRCKAAVF